MKIDRLFSILLVLLERRKVSITELADLYEVSPRTISRDVETLNLAGIPVVSFPGPGGGVGILETFKLEKRIFSAADITALLMGLGCVRSSLPAREVTDVLTKIRALIPAEQRREIELRSGRLAVDMTPWAGSVNRVETVETVQRAMEKSLLLQFGYTDRLGNRSERTVEPYRLVLKGMRWYLDAYCLQRQAFRLFKLSRMHGLQESDLPFTARNYCPSAVVQPDFKDEGLVSATLRVRGSCADHLEEVYGAEIFFETDGEWRIARIPAACGESFFRFLLGFGTDCVCLEPQSLRDGVKTCAQKIAELYGAG